MKWIQHDAPRLSNGYNMMPQSYQMDDHMMPHGYRVLNVFNCFKFQIQ